jgi:esterase/lipase superfamily enzyme
MPKYWMITNRNTTDGGLGGDQKPLGYYVADQGPLSDFSNWRKVGSGNSGAAKFQTLLAAAADRFPLIEDAALNEYEKHVSIFIHGYNNDWADAAARYESICAKIFEPADLGICVLFSWPSDGMKLGYLADRMDAEKTAPALSEVLNGLYDWMAAKQAASAADPTKTCKAKTSIIAHSMGNYVLQKAMQYTWTQKNRPLLVSLVNQLLMVAADVDNDLFRAGEAVTTSDGDAIANLSYRVTALYTGRDPVLGLSAGFKHFGKRRLGRSGLDGPVPDNVWGVDCSARISAGAQDIHSCYFDEPGTIALMQQVLRGVDRKVITQG